MAMLHRVLRTRDERDLPVAVWPHEGASTGTARHLLVEGYPAILPRHSAASGHAADALRMVAALKAAHETGRLGDLLRSPVPSFGRYHGVDVTLQMQFEGWIVGLA